MVYRVSSDILSPRELRKQISRYFNFSGLVWVILTLVGVVFFLHFEVVQGVAFPIWTSPSLCWSFVWRLFVLLFLSVLVGYIVAIPSVILLWIANSGSAFSAPKRGGASVLRRGISGVFPPGLCVFLHGAVLLLSLGANPAWVANSFLGSESVVSVIRSVHETFFSPSPVEISKNWRKAFASKEPALLVLELPSSLLREPGSLPLLEKELGSSFPFFLDSPNYESQTAQLLDPELAFSRRILVAKPDMSSLAEKVNSNHLLVEGSPENREMFDSPASERIQARHFLSRRLAMSQPHFFLLGRIGLLGVFFDGMAWGELVADDRYKISQFLDRGAIDGFSASPRILQLSEFGDLDVFEMASPSRWPEKSKIQLQRESLRTLDFLVGRGVGALRQNRQLSIAVVPYAERLNVRSYSRAFLKLAEGVEDPLGSDVRSGKSHMRIYDLRKLLRMETWPGFGAESKSASSGLNCQGTRVSLDLLLEKGNDVRNEVFREIRNSVQSTDHALVSLEPGMKEFPYDLFSFAAFCRMRDGTSDKLVVWSGNGGGKPGDRGGLGLRELFLTNRAQVSGKNDTPVLRKKEVASTSAVTSSNIILSDRLMVWNVVPGLGLQRDPNANEFLLRAEALLRPVFERLVMLERVQ
jgi:hypothetical protein